MTAKATAEETTALNALGENLGIAGLSTLFEKHAQVWRINGKSSENLTAVIDKTLFPDSARMCDSVEMAAKIYDPEKPELRRIRLQFTLKRAANENHQARVLDVSYLKESGKNAFALTSLSSTLKTLENKIMLPVSDSAVVQNFVALAQKQYTGQPLVMFDQNTRLTIK